MIKVLMLVHNLRNANGVASYAMNYFRNLDRTKIRMDFAVYEKLPSPYYDEIHDAGSKLYVLPPIKNIFVHLKECKKILADGEYNIIHDNTLINSLPMMLMARINHIPVRILHSHSSKLGENNQKELRNKILLPFLIETATDLVACSKTAGKAMFGSKKYVFVPNVIDSSKFRFDKERREIIRRKYNVDSKKIVGTVGRITIAKNPFFAIDVFEKLLRIEPESEYWWIGNGVLDRELELYIKKRGLQKSVKLLGSRDDVKDFYQTMDCFFLPSLFEGLPVTCIEAQAMGLPIIASDTITSEMVYTDLVDYLSLKDSEEEWSMRIKKALEKDINRGPYADKLHGSIFSDYGCGERLCDMYRFFLNQSK